MSVKQHKLKQNDISNLFYQYEQQLKKQGYHAICGVDEAGRGCLAGPVTAAAVILGDWWDERIDDSKKLSPVLREELYNLITKKCLQWSVTNVSPQIIDEINIYQAARKAMTLSVEKLASDYCLSDAMPLPDLQIEVMPIVHGDQICRSIAAASVVAKVTRDRLMVEYDSTYPNYGFARHKGYGTAMHIEKLRLYGPSPIHRKSFKPIKGLLQK